MTFQDDCTDNWIQRLTGQNREGKQAFARDQWAHLTKGGARPDYLEYGISHNAATSIVLELAGRK